MGITSDNVNNNILGAKRAQELTKGIAALENSKGDLSANKSELKTLFSQKYFNSTADKATIDKKIEVLEAKIKEAEEKIADLKDQIDGKQDKLTKISEELAEKIAEIVTDTGVLEEDYRQGVTDAIEEARQEYLTAPTSKKKGGNQTFNDFLIIHMKSLDGIANRRQTGIQNAIDELSAPQGQLKKIADDMGNVIDDIDGLEDSYATEKSTLVMLKHTRNNMTDAAKSYQTSDTDPSVPIFTPEKAELADGYLSKYNSRLAGRDNQVSRATAEDRQAIVDKYKGMAGNATGNDKYSVDNEQLVNFGNQFEDMLSEMTNAGFTKAEMLNAISEAYPSIGISHTDDGAAYIPYGHWAQDEARSLLPQETKAGAIYTKFTDVFSAIEGSGQRDDLQVAEMGNAINNDDIINEMAKNDYSWKECAYTLTRLWPASGIEYKLGDKEITIPKGNGDQAAIYDKLANDILANYDVTVNRGTPAAEGDVADVERHDPVGFSIGNESYEFVIDRAPEGILNNFNELLGYDGQDGIEELRIFDTNNDGIIDANDKDSDGNKMLDKLLLMNVSHADGNKDVLNLNKQEQNIENDMTNYEFLSASQLGISKIDLNSYTKKEQQRADGGTDDFIDINNSLVTGTFDITVNGDKVEGYQKFATDDYMNAIYGHMMGENIYSELAQDQLNEGMDAYDDANNNIKDLIDFRDTLKNGDGLIDGDIKSALTSKLVSSMNNVRGEKSKLVARENIKYSQSALGNTTQETTEMTEKKADKVITNHLDNCEDSKKGKKLKEELEDNGYLNEN